MRALLLAYYFPPSGGPGVQRGVKLCRYLPEHGVEVDVVTVTPQTYGLAGEYAGDPTLGGDLPPGIRVSRTPAGFARSLARPLARLRLLRLARAWAPGSFFERQAAWYAPALARCLREVADRRPDVLLTTSQPYVSHLVGRAVRARTGIPWVADFRDPWTLSWGRSWPSRSAFSWEDDREQEVLAAADVVVANTPGSRRELLERRPWLAREKVRVVTNGYDEVDFAVEAAERPEGEFLVVHSGSFRARPPGAPVSTLRRLARRGEFTPAPYDLSTHSPAPLLRALAELETNPGTRPVRARLVGPLAEGWRVLARDLGVEDRIDVLGPRPHGEAVSQLLAADLLYLPTITRTDGRSVSNVPAKTYEYLGSGKPLAVLAGPGDVYDLAAPRDRARVLAPRPDSSLGDLLREASDGLGRTPVGVDPRDAHPFRRREVAGRMASALRAACEGGTSFEPGGDDKSHGPSTAAT